MFLQLGHMNYSQLNMSEASVSEEAKVILREIKSQTNVILAERRRLCA